MLSVCFPVVSVIYVSHFPNVSKTKQCVRAHCSLLKLLEVCSENCPLALALQFTLLLLSRKKLDKEICVSGIEFTEPCVVTALDQRESFSHVSMICICRVERESHI